MRKQSFLVSTALLALTGVLLMALCSSSVSNVETLRASRALQADEDTRPVMYTFYYQIPITEHRSTGMSNADDEALLLEWRRFWGEAGWRPKVLGLNTAKQHPFYDEFVKALEGMPFGFYDKLCFIRWLAIAQVGGGFMSDYDTFPLHDFLEDGKNLPNKGEFTMYENLVPAVVSGTEEEYLRISKLMVESAIRNRSERHFSDMLALVDIYHTSDGNAFHKHRDVIHGTQVLNGVEVWSEEDCQMTDHKRAVHFSHRSMNEAKLSFAAKAKDRPVVARNWLEMWKKQCSQAEKIVTLKTDDLPPVRRKTPAPAPKRYDAESQPDSLNQG